MDLWEQVAVPYICERMLGFSVPQDDTVLIVSYEGRHLLRLGPTITVQTDRKYSEYDLYDPAHGLCHYQERAWDIIGLFSGRPILTSPIDEQLVVDPIAQTVSVVREREVLWLSFYENFSGDWVAATFSPDGRFILLGCPDGSDFRVWTRNSEVQPLAKTNET